MRKIVGLLAALALLTPALAYSSDHKTVVVAPPQSLAANVERLGYDLQSSRERGGLYHANLLDRDTGKLVHAEFRMADGELIAARLLARDED